MAFVPNDLYLASGVTGVFNSWTPTVTKFDSSTFYNWEQDNEPIYDLDERTSLLWEKMGYPIANDFSGISGKMFVVSSNATFAGQSSGIIFKSLSAVINVLPNPITYPIVIEVASYGDLGYLDLNGIKIDKTRRGAGLEIINRNFGRTSNGDATFTGAPVSALNSTNLYETMLTTCCLATSGLVASAYNDSRWNGSNRAWITPITLGYSNQSLGTGYITFNSTTLLPSLNKVIFDPYDSTDDTTLGQDYISASAYANELTGYDNTLGIAGAGNYAFAALYGNYLQGVKIDNCAGPIYIRNFCVDGAKNTSNATLNHSESYGFEIINSNVTLENSFALRCRKAGFRFVNSNVTVRRGLFSARNYPVIASTRSTSGLGIGLDSLNSVISIESQSSPVTVSGIDIPFQLAFNDIGMKLVNSQLLGGNKKSSNGTFGSEFGVTVLDVFCNKNYGIVLKNSLLSHEGANHITQNYNGILMDNSVAEFNNLVVKYSQGIGLEATNSKVVQNPALVQISKSDAYLDNHWWHEQFTFGVNGQHLVLDNSIFEYTRGVNLPSKYGRTLFHNQIGVDQNPLYATMKPGVVVQNNSYAEFIHSKMVFGGPNAKSADLQNDDAIFGLCLSVQNNSKTKLLGSVTAETLIVGPPQETTNVALVYATDNSEIEFNGNTAIAQGAIDVLAQNNSIIKFNPHKTEANTFDVSGWSLSNSDNHTRVELHSTRSCLVAESNSKIEMSDLGHIYTSWDATQFLELDYDNNESYFEDTAKYTSAGYIQFYPNPQDSAFFAVSTSLYNLDSGGGLNRSFNTDLNAGVYDLTSKRLLVPYTNYSDTSSQILKCSTGGVCVRALRGSDIKVFNVNFPAGWQPASGVYYDSSSTGAAQQANRLRIWNICDTSKLDAAYCSVSGLYPSSTPIVYKGPSAVWTSGASVVASGMPAGTADTGSVSIIDLYGASGASTGTNYGIFRLYFSPTTRTKYLAFSGVSATAGVPYQLISQGYNLSGAAIMYAGSSVYTDPNTLYYYASGLISPNFVNQIRLDESAANVFSNARHNAVAKSGRNALVTIIRSGTADTIGSQAFDSLTYGFGKGFKSAEIFDLRRLN